jgi:predicted DNA-binding ribbon-helix-helix protein
MGSRESATSGPIKRSLTIAGHDTSISLEPVFWEALKRAAASEGLPINALVARVDFERIQSSNPPNLASAIRVWLMQGLIDGADYSVSAETRFSKM